MQQATIQQHQTKESFGETDISQAEVSIVSLFSLLISTHEILNLKWVNNIEIELLAFEYETQYNVDF